MNLFDRKCLPSSNKLEENQVKAMLQELKVDWELVDGKKIRHGFMFPDFKSLMEFVNKIADVAEVEGHHPDIHIFYNKLVIDLSTHFAKGLTENDFIIASKIEKLI